MGCTMSMEIDRILLQFLLQLVLFIFLIYILKHVIKNNKMSFFKVAGLVICELIVIELSKHYTMCSNGCDTSCPLYAIRPLMNPVTVILAIINCSMIIYIVELKVKFF